jgi:hypothetical protein
MCVKMADTILLDGLGGGYVDNRMVVFHILNRDGMKEVSFLFISCLDQQGSSTKTTGIVIYIMFTTPKK